MILIFLSLCICEPGSGVQEASAQAQGILERMRAGERFSSIVDVGPVLHEFPEARSLVTFLDGMHMPSESCFSRVIKNLNVTDCDHMSDAQQRSAQKQFTMCYFHIIGRETNITADQPLSSNLSPEEYSTYTAMKIHLSNLCHFARQSIFHEETSKKLITLFQSVLNSSNAVADMKGAMAKASTALNTSIADIQERLKEGKDFMAKITAEINSFGTTLNQTMELLVNPLNHMDNLKMILVFVIFLFFVAMFLPQYLLPVIGFTIVLFILEQFLRTKIDNWDKSIWRIGARLVYVLVCVSYPFYTVLHWIGAASRMVKWLSTRKRSTVLVLPRMNRAQYRQSPIRPRYYY
jgi:hypothetical protein